VGGLRVSEGDCQVNDEAPMSAPLATRVVFLSLSCICLPLLVMSVYLYYSRHSASHFTTKGDFIASAAGVVSGAICMHWLVKKFGWASRSMPFHVGAVVLYVVVASFILYVYSLEFVCSVFGDCL
jgi:hypothetical protein